MAAGGSTGINLALIFLIKRYNLKRRYILRKGLITMKKFIFIILLSLVLGSVAIACTSILVTKGASNDGSVIVTHEADGELGDPRFIYVPAADHKPGSKRAVYPYHLYFPRYVGTDRGPGYDIKGYPQSKPVGYIPQVEHTYAYVDSIFGIMNEHQLQIGEVTTGAKLEPEASAKRLFYSTELSRVALERCKTAREAVELMGQLIDDYGYYGTGESLLVADTQEGWIFEMGGTPDGQPDLWVARKVPDGKVYVTANEYRIREIKKNNPDMIYSKNLFKTTKALGWWNPKDGEFDWLRAVGIGEYNHPYYSLRRVWRAMDRINPDLKLSPWVKDGYTKDYPFAITPKTKLTLQNVMSLHNDHYEGTEFDLTKGTAAGPFGNPNRYFGPYDGAQNNAVRGQKTSGAWERAISADYCTYVKIGVSRDWLPDPIGGMVWIGFDRPDTTVYVPFYIGVNDLPVSYRNGSPFKYDRKFMWWAFDFVSNWADLKYSYMIKDINAKQKEIQDKEFADVAKIDQKALKLYKIWPRLARYYLTRYSTKNANWVQKEWCNLADTLIAKYSQGYMVVSDKVTEVGYPKAWLDKTNYADGPVRYEKPKKK